MAILNNPKRVKRFGIFPVDVDVEYLKPIIGRLIAFPIMFWAFLRITSFKKLDILGFYGKPIVTYYCIIYPRFRRIK